MTADCPDRGRRSWLAYAVARGQLRHSRPDNHFNRIPAAAMRESLKKTANPLTE